MKIVESKNGFNVNVRVSESPKFDENRFPKCKRNLTKSLMLSFSGINVVIDGVVELICPCYRLTMKKTTSTITSLKITRCSLIFELPVLLLVIKYVS